VSLANRKTFILFHESVLRKVELSGGALMERTLSIVKPDGVERGLVGEVIKRFENAGIRIAAMKMICLTGDQAKKFYAVHKERPFYDSLTQFMSSGPIVVMALEGESVIAKNRELMGATDFRKADPGTIRHDFARDIEKNIVHGSDAVETAKSEIAFFFGEMDICGSQSSQ
jgi:nucleoside-diphosphate kinase